MDVETIKNDTLSDEEIRDKLDEHELDMSTIAGVIYETFNLVSKTKSLASKKKLIVIANKLTSAKKSLAEAMLVIHDDYKKLE